MAFVAVAEAGAGRAAAGRAAGSRTAARKGAASKGASRGAARASAPATEAGPGLDSAGQLAGALPPEGTKAREQREAVEEIKAKRAADEDQDEDQDEEHDEHAGRRIDPPAAGAGLVLGVMVWAVVLNYIQGGTPQVRRLLRAKFLNRID